MPARLYILFMIIKIISSNTTTHWSTTFPGKLEQFLNVQNLGISPHCTNHLLRFTEALKLEQKWALKMYNSGAKNLPSKIMRGNLVDLGNFDECLNIHEQEISGKYCIGNTHINSKKLQTKSTLVSGNSLYTVASKNGTISVHLARCFPEACTITEMENVYAAIDFEVTFSTDLCQTKSTQTKINTATLITGFIVLFIACVGVYASYRDIISHRQKTERPHPMLTAFSHLENGRKLFDTSRSSTDVSCVHGIRVLTCMWIILFHRMYALAFVPINNFFYYQDWFKNPINMLIHSASLGVDTFFLLSGLFVAYNYMNNAAKGVKFNVVSYYTQRYLRLTAPLGMCVLILNISKLISSGPLWTNVVINRVNACEISWWRVLLHLQNFNMDDNPMCLEHSWSISTDMQLFILSPLLLIPLKRWPNPTFILIGFLATCSMIASFIVGLIYEINPIVMANENLNEFLFRYYFPVYTRATPWLIGLVLGYFLNKKTAMKCKEKTVYFAVMVLLACVFVGHGLIENKSKRFLSALHFALVRPIWAAAMSWVIFACAKGYGGVLDRVLSLRIFHVLSKLTFGIYLVHPMIIFGLVSGLRTPLVFSPFDLLYKFWGDFALSILPALMLVLGIEMPLMTIYKYLTSPKKKIE